MTSMAEGARPWRCFWAVPLPADLRRGLAEFVAELGALPAVEDAWRFTAADSWHLTLAFLGAVEPDTVKPMIQRVVSAVGDRQPFEITTAGLGGFPRGGRARVLWYGVDGGDELTDLTRDVRAAAGADDEQPWRAHVTLARSRDRRGAELPASADPPSGVIHVNEVVLFRSHLGAGPARYEALHRVALGAPVGTLSS